MKIIVIVFCLGLVSCAGNPRIKKVKTLSLRVEKIKFDDGYCFKFNNKKRL